MKSRWERLTDWVRGWRWDTGAASQDRLHSCSVPLSRAMVCLDCWQVGLVGSRCSTCGSTGCMMLVGYMATEK